jgi:hypothetical protein
LAESSRNVNFAPDIGGGPAASSDEEATATNVIRIAAARILDTPFHLSRPTDAETATTVLSF